MDAGVSTQYVSKSLVKAPSSSTLAACDLSCARIWVAAAAKAGSAIACAVLSSASRTSSCKTACSCSTSCVTSSSIMVGPGLAHAEVASPEPRIPGREVLT